MWSMVLGKKKVRRTNIFWKYLLMHFLSRGILRAFNIYLNPLWSSKSRNLAEFQTLLTTEFCFTHSGKCYAKPQSRQCRRHNTPKLKNLSDQPARPEVEFLKVLKEYSIPEYPSTLAKTIMPHLLFPQWTDLWIFPTIYTCFWDTNLSVKFPT